MDSDDSWTLITGGEEDAPLVARFDTRFEDVALREGRTIQLGIAVPLKKPKDNGLPTKEEMQVLSGIEDEITRLVGARAVLVGVITTGGMREFVLYAATGDWIAAFDKDLQAAVPSHEVQVMAQEDAAWEAYEQFVEPA